MEKVNSSQEIFEDKLNDFLNRLGMRLDDLEKDDRIVYFLTVKNKSEGDLLIEKIKEIFKKNECITIEFDWSKTSSLMGEFLVNVKQKEFESKPILIVNFAGEKQIEQTYGESVLNNREAIMIFLKGIIIVNTPQNKIHLREILPDLFTVRDLGIENK